MNRLLVPILGVTLMPSVILADPFAYISQRPEVRH